ALEQADKAHQERFRLYTEQCQQALLQKYMKGMLLLALRRLAFQYRVQADQAYTPIGSMQAWITLMNPAQVLAGGLLGDPTPFVQTWAKVSALFAQEKRESQQIVKEVTHLIVIPY